MLDPITASALISGGVNAFGSILGLGSTNKAAKASLQATRETNATNERLVKEMNAFNALQHPTIYNIIADLHLLRHFL